jgi:very-short-patch-repair endonuclease/uncharacterized protein YjiS (DUF1127 family)
VTTSGPAPLAPRTHRRHRLARALALADDQHGVVSLSQLRDLGVTRAQVRAQVAAGRWRRVHSQVVAVHAGPLPQAAQLWAAVLEAGPSALLDGVAALVAAGLAGFDLDTIRVSVPRGSRTRHAPGVTIRETRRLCPDDRAPGALPRVRPEVAAVRGGLWARSDKQAALIVTMTVQQRLTTPERIGRALLDVRRHRRRELLRTVILDLLDGVRALSEAEFARECRARGLPEPSRQVVRRGKDGRYYLDAYWEAWGVVVEIDGIQHAWAGNVVRDALRQNDITLAHDVVLRLPLLGLRVAADEFFEQIGRALRDGGCPYGSDRIA